MQKKYKKTSIRLTHPRLNIVIEKIIQGPATKESVIQDLKWKYGQKFYECKLEYLTNKVYIFDNEKKEVYFGTSDTVKKTGLSKSIILRHLKGNYKNRKVRFAWMPGVLDITKEYGK